MLRIISECMPRYAIFENVTGLLTGESGKWFGQFLYDLAEIGFDAEWHCIEAGYLGAPHRRDRVWVIAYPAEQYDGASDKEQIERQESKFGESISEIGISANTDSKRQQGFAKVAHDLKQQAQLMRSSKANRERFNLTEPALLGANDGVSRGMDRKRIARLGNSVIPQIPEAIGRAIMGAV